MYVELRMRKEKATLYVKKSKSADLLFFMVTRTGFEPMLKA